MMAVMLPFWTSFLIRVYAWIGILKNDGLLNHALIVLGLIHTPLRLYRTNAGVYIGMVYSYLPFMVMPLYAHLVKMDLRCSRPRTTSARGRGRRSCASRCRCRRTGSSRAACWCSFRRSAST
jgi:hypothetical protein